MTSEIEALKTNEFHRRRKLRIQQVREQSKDIAKKIRQRAKVEKWRHVGELDAKKEQEYLQHQEKLVKRLEEFYVKGLEKVGASHRLASEVNLQEDIPEKTDLSKVRAKEAAAELRRKKQEKLDKQKKLLDRKVQAREAANEISREKSSTVSSKLLTKSASSKSLGEAISKVDVACGTATDDKENSNPDEGDKPDIVTSDMATQWDFEGMPNEWEPHIPKLSLPKDDTESIKESNSRNTDTRGGRKRPNLFALSSEMPSSLRGGLSSVPEEQAPQKPSLTLVSEYLQNRGLRLREFDTPSTSKKAVEDLNSIKQTIMRTRANKEGSMFNNVCHVADVQIVPVPSWQAEVNCGHCCHKNHQHCPLETREFKSIPNSQINKIFSSIRPVQRDLHPSPVLRGSSPFRRSKVCHPNYKPPVSVKGNPTKSTKTSDMENALNKKKSVTTYNHSTRDSKDVPCDKSHVVRDQQTNEDAYSQAMKEVTSEKIKDKEHQKKLQDTRNKIAMTRQNVEKEYKDTMNFLSSLPKDSKPIKKAYMDEQRQQMQKDNRQQKLQYEYKKIEKEFKRNLHKHPKQKTQDKRSSKSKCPGELDSDEDFHTKDFQYSWMPVPESDGNLVIHTIPNAVKEGKAGSSVKFTNIDSYHEYRSRHKHTPPTKDTSSHEKTVKRTIETIVLEPSDNEFTDGSSISSETSSVENLMLDQNKDLKSKGSEDEITLSNADRIIIYKVLEKKSKMSKTLKDTAKSIGFLDAEEINKSLRKDVDKQETQQSAPGISKNSDARVSFEQLNEGVYKTVNERGDNVTSLYFTDTTRDGPGLGVSTIQEEDETERIKPRSVSCSCTKKPDSQSDADGPGLGVSTIQEEDETERIKPRSVSCSCTKKPDSQSDAESNVHWQRGDESTTSRLHNHKADQRHKCTKETENNRSCPPQPSAATSAASFKTATNIKMKNETTDDGFIKLLDEAGQETGKFYIGASGLLNNDAYEVVIQLRKKDGAKDTKEDQNRQTVPSVTQVITLNDTQLNTDSIPKVIQQTKEAQEQLPSKTPTKDNLNVVSTQCSTQPNDVDSGKPEDPNGNVNNKQTVYGSESGDNMLTEEPVGDANDFAIKDGYTPFELPYVVPGRVQKTVMEPGLATSTHTETTPTSPRQRPVFIHMSSSTSTAYMSPPELVLPKFLKHNYKLNYEEINDPTQNSVLEDACVEIINKEEYCEKYEGCQCRRCTHARKITLTKIKRPMSSYREKRRSNNMRAPPNSARSFGNAYQSDACDTNRTMKEIFAKTTPKKIKSTCHTCESRTGSKPCVKTCTQKSKRNIPVNQKLSRNGLMRVYTLPKTSYKNKSTYIYNEKCFGKPNLNPTVKSYVDKLLALNKDGLKALAVVNQDCSSVGTPGSSIIEVNRNIDNNMPAVETKISLEQIKDVLTQQILEKYQNEIKRKERGVSVSTESNIKRKYPRIPKKKSVHKVKSLNISKNLFNNNTTTSEPSNKCSRVNSSPSSKKSIPMPTRTKFRSKSSPSARRVDGKISGQCSDIKNNQMSDRKAGSMCNVKQMLESWISVEPFRKSQGMVTSSDEANHKLLPPSNISTQTSRNIDDEINFMKMAQDKLQNMEKIADLTEKCTIRLSNLAKVLEEVRKNKSLVYSQVSDSASDSDRKSDKITLNDKPQTPYDPPCEINVEIKKIRTPPPTPISEVGNSRRASESRFMSDLKQGKRNRSTDNFSNSAVTDSDLKSDRSTTNKKSSTIYGSIEQNKEATPREAIGARDNSGADLIDYSKYTPFLSDIPKPEMFKSAAPPPVPPATPEQLSRHQSNESFDHPNTKRGKPPPALSRMNLKHGRDIIVPHELSTVLEVDSPMSAKVKNQSTQNETKCDDQVPDTCNKEQQSDVVKNDQQNKDQYVNPDLLQSNLHLSRRQTNMSNDSSDDAKLQMMDLNKFNEIMLKPFISIREYAKQCNVESLDEGSNLDDIARDDVINDELSSLHSDASLPDVIAELLKRNIITEPFKYDTVSNVNSNTVSSESTLSMLALSKVRKGKKNAGVVFKHKDNVAETSDTLSVSSNPDLENAFKKLGMGWASSTLKKTKERLALSSSSNTSSSSLSHFKVPSVPGLVTESGSSVLGMSNKSLQGNVANEGSINVEQQTSRLKSMTVHEFLTNELAKKITFTNKSYRNDTEEEFVSLYETKMPVDMKNASPMLRDERSMDSAPSGGNNRARTSTPVQIFKSMTYHSSSSSNMSNGLFSNADDLSSVKGTSNSMRNHSTSDKDDLTIPNYSLRMRKDVLSDYSKSD